MKKLGQFEVTGDKLMVTDPCYRRGTWRQGIIDNVLQGMWSGFVKYEDNDEGGTVSEILAQHPSYTPGDGRWVSATFEVGVDSGQAGIFDEARYPVGEIGSITNRNSFYGSACEATSHPEKGGTIKEGVVSCSGYGDGGYVCEFHVNKAGKVDAVCVDFLGGDLGPFYDDDYDDDLDLEDEEV